jgi:hypothetical protein
MSYLGYLGFKTGQRTSVIGDDDEMLPWEPVDAWYPTEVLGSSLTHWWNADDIATHMVDSGGGRITSWTDRVAGLAVTATGAARPLWEVASFNGLPGITFNGIANCFVTTDLSTLPTGSTAGEIWAVVRQDTESTITQSKYMVSYGGTSAETSRNIYRTAASLLNRARCDDGTTSTTVPPATYPFNGLSIIRAGWSGTTQSISALGLTPTTGTISALNTGTTRLSIGALNNSGGSGFWIGAVCHVMITTGTLTDAQADGLYRWLAWDSGILGSLLSSNQTRP